MTVEGEAEFPRTESQQQDRDLYTHLVQAGAKEQGGQTESAKDEVAAEGRGQEETTGGGAVPEHWREKIRTRRNTWGVRQGGQEGVNGTATNSQEGAGTNDQKVR
jgi:hypothetical protein